MSNSVSAVYFHVVGDVFGKIRSWGVVDEDDSALSELRSLWELKMMQSGVVKGPIERNSAPSGPTPVHDLNVPYEATGELATPTVDMFFTPTPLQTPIQTPLPGSTPLPGTTPLPGSVQTPLPVDPGHYQHFPSGQGEYGTAPDTVAEFKAGRPASYMQQPSPWMNQRPLGVDVNVAYEEARDEEGGNSDVQPPMKDFFGKRKRDDYPSHMFPNGSIPQQDGSGDSFLERPLHRKFYEFQLPAVKSTSALQEALELEERKKADAMIASMIERKKQLELSIPQHDGFDDEVVPTEDYNNSTPGYYDATTPAIPLKSESTEDDEPPLNEDDDEDDLDDVEEGEDEFNLKDVVLSQFEKVSRTKSKWKCILKDGIMRLNDRDILFNKANGEFDF